MRNTFEGYNEFLFPCKTGEVKQSDYLDSPYPTVTPRFLTAHCTALNFHQITLVSVSEVLSVCAVYRPVCTPRSTCIRVFNWLSAVLEERKFSSQSCTNPQISVHLYASNFSL